MSDELFNIRALRDELSLFKNFFTARTVMDLNVYQKRFLY